MDAADRRRQLGIRDRPPGRRPCGPVVVAGGRDVQKPAGHRDGDTVRGELLDQPEPYFGSTFSLAKYALARLRISFSISSTRFRRRNSTSSCASEVTPALRPESIASRFIQFRRQDSLIPRSRAVSRDGVALRDEIQGSTPELRRVSSRHLADSSLRRSSPQLRCPEKRVRLRDDLCGCVVGSIGFPKGSCWARSPLLVPAPPVSSHAFGSPDRSEHSRTAIHR
jgi:hypothetical protein